MKVALVKPPGTYANWYKRPVLGVTYICSVLESNGFESRVFDAYFHNWSESELLRRVADYQPDAVGISAMTHEVNAAALIASSVKNELGVPVIIGGCHVTALPKRTLTEFSDFDYGVYGEGEQTCLELLQCLQEGTTSDLSSIPGIVFRDDGDVVVNESRPNLTPTELDALPWPALDQYYAPNIDALAARDEYYVMFTSRGCPYKCAFCMPGFGQKSQASLTCEHL